MRVELPTLLRTKTVCHPSTLVSALFANGGELRIKVIGHPWWLADPHGPADRSIEFVFAGVSDGALAADDFSDSEWDEALEAFEVVDVSGADWAQPESHSIYCSSPLPDPLKLFLKIQDYLLAAAAFHRPEKFLNTGDTERLSKFVEISSTQSYLLGRVPKGVCDIICQELDAQAVAYNVQALPLSRSGLLVTLGSSVFLCETAHAEFEE